MIEKTTSQQTIILTGRINLHQHKTGLVKSNGFERKG